MNRAPSWRSLFLVASGVLCATQLFAQTAVGWQKSGLEDLATFDREIMVQMRDGVRLSTSLLMPKTPNGKMPAILIRTPYDRNGELDDNNSSNQ